MKELKNEETAVVLEIVPEELAKVVDKERVEPDARDTLLGAFTPLHAEITKALRAASRVTNGENPLERSLARECRLALKNARCDAETTRKRLKAGALSFGRAVDGMANIIKFLCEPEESRLQEIEKYEEVQEAKRKEELRAIRTAELLPLGADPGAYNLGTMDEATWQAVLGHAKADKAARDEAARKAEAERVAKAEAERQEREARVRAAEVLAAQARIEAERERQERAKLAAEYAKERAAAQERERQERAKLAAETEARRVAQAEAMRLAEVEAQRRAAVEAEAQRRAEAAAAAALAPDKDKLQAFVKSIGEISPPICSTVVGRAMCADIVSMRDRFINLAELCIANI